VRDDVSDKDDEFLKRLLVTFTVEAQEHLQEICSGLLRLEKDENSPEACAELLETVFREAHSLKGAARAVNQTAIEALCQALESVFAGLKKGVLSTSAGFFDLLQEVVDFLEFLLLNVGKELTHKDKVLQRHLISRLEAAITCGTAPAEVSPILLRGEGPGEVVVDSGEGIKPNMPVLTETVRIATPRLISVLLQTEEMLAATLASSQRIIDMRSVSSTFGAWKKEWSKILPIVENFKNSGVRGEVGQQDLDFDVKQPAVAKILNFMDWNSDFIKSLDIRLKAEIKSAERDDRAFGGMVNTLLDDMKKVLMFPFSSLLEILPKIVRDLSRENGKEIEVSINGGEIEIDRRILEEMKDPLVHLIRNCIDHGIESPVERLAKGKLQHGTIRVAIVPVDNMVELSVSDDGRGISLDNVRSALIKFGTLPGERVAELRDQELMAQIFQSGITTSPIITEISGRGLGLAIVREKVGKSGGTVSVDSTPDSGTTFRILLPLTVATFRGILVRLGERQFVLPAMNVERVLRVKPEEIMRVENRNTISIGGVPVSLVSLADVLELSDLLIKRETSAQLAVVVLRTSDMRIAFQVDEVSSECEVLHKGLGLQLSRVRNVAGATLLGSGHVALILNVTDLLNSAVKMSSFTSPQAGNAETDEISAQLCSILVAEDSITTRTLLKNILDSAGYDVSTAVDGMDALTKLKCGNFNIVVSDVEMPRMNGFDLTTCIRADKNLKDLPVILVTALASREDRERGIDAGADAYIVKGSFDQSNLLEVIQKLV
jgi:two-component system chemotaxis sensor kinase CheA